MAEGFFSSGGWGRGGGRQGEGMDAGKSSTDVYLIEG